MARCYIAGAGEFTGGIMPMPGDFVIAADGGYSELAARGIVPDLVVGDFDSLGAVPYHPNVLRSPKEKDDTDMMLAVRQGIGRGYEQFVIDGGMDGRFDHTLANLQVLAYIARNGALGVLLGSSACVTAVTAGCVGFLPGMQAVFAPVANSRPLAAESSLHQVELAPPAYISVFSFGGKAEGVTLTGLKYPLDNASLTCDDPIGVSNEFTDEPATVSVRSGTLLITWTGGAWRLDL